jgi:GNAT superfamily N-acetyltransferase
MPTLTITSEPHANPEDITTIEDNINEMNMRITGDRDYHLIVVFLRDEHGVLKGGIRADAWGGWLHVKFLWVDESLRHHGWGAKLLQAAEDEARGYGCKNAHVETFSFQARPFYERFGYHVIAELPDYPPGHTHYILRKSLETRI